MYSTWWHAQGLDGFPDHCNEWRGDLEKEWIRAVSLQEFSNEGFDAVIILSEDSAGSVVNRICKSPDEVVEAWRSGWVTGYEFRAWQNNPLSFYLGGNRNNCVN